jgi:cytochrome c553
MRRLLVLALVAAFAAAMLPAARAGLTSAQKRELAAIRKDVGKITSLIRKKQFDEAEQALADAETKLDDYVQAEMIAADEPLLHSVRQLLDKQKAILIKAGGKPKTESVSFTDEIAPLLAKSCLGCHGDNPKGGLRLDTFAGMEKGGAHPPLLVIGKPDLSLLLARIATPNPQVRMPKDADPLSEDEIKKISDWIAAGAKFDGADKNTPLDKLEKPKPPIEVAKPTGNERVSFIKDVAPGFVTVCLGCHNGNTRRGGLSMVTFEKLMQGGDSGKVIVARNLDESRLWTLINDGDMPRGQARISQEWYNNLKIWIEEGCKYDHADPRAELAKLIPTEQELKIAELARLSPEEFSQRRLAASQDQWTRSFPQAAPKVYESAEFNVFGDVSEARLKEINDWAVEQAEALRATFNAKEKPLFRGKLTIFVCKDRFGYEEFNATIDRREVPREVVGHAKVTPATQEEAYVVLQEVGDDANENSPGMRLNLMEQLTGAFLRRDAKGDMPDWLVRGAGLALGARSDLGGSYLSSLRKSAGTVLANARLERPEQIFQDGTFSPSDVDAIGLTAVEFLLKQGGAAKFGQLVRRAQAGEKTAEAIKAVYGVDTKALGQAYAVTYAGGAASRKK